MTEPEAVPSLLPTDPVTQWLLRGSTSHRKVPADFVAELAQVLNEAGYAIDRVSVWVPTLHPELWGTQLTWDAERGCRVILRQHTVTETDDYIGSPGEFIHRDGAPSLRCRLDVPRDAIPFDLLRGLADEGFTDYYILSLDPEEGRRPWIAFATRRSGGFRAAEVGLLTSVAPLLGLHFRLTRATYATQSLLDVYLGPNAARRVLDGEFRRGSGTEIRCAMWFCDMRGFTAMSDRLTPREVVSVLDAYFELVAEPIERHAGEILKFIGDAVLAIFPIEDDAADPCRRALVAAEEVLTAIGRWSSEEKGRPELSVGVGLHVGEVMYGNIGGRGRLDFTVIGGSVNEVCRVEALCKELGVPLLMTKGFASALGRDDLVVLGRQALRGVAELHDIITTPAHTQKAPKGEHGAS
jgi:adenylate cyclase